MPLLCLTLLIFELSCLAWLGSAHRFEPLPEFAPRIARILKEAPQAESKSMVTIKDMDDASIARLKSMRRKQIGELSNIRNELKSVKTDETPSSSRLSQAQFPKSTKESRAMLKDVLLKPESNVSLVWFGATLPLPLVFRASLWLPFLGLPLALFRLRPRFRRKTKQESDAQTLTRFIRKKDAQGFLKAAETLGGEHYLRVAPVRFKIQALHCLMQNDCYDAVLQWGATFTSLHPQHKGLTRCFAEYLALHRQRIPTHLHAWLLEILPLLRKDIQSRLRKRLQSPAVETEPVVPQNS